MGVADERCRLAAVMRAGAESLASLIREVKKHEFEDQIRVFFKEKLVKFSL